MIQPQVPLRLPCYDFAPVTELTFGGCPLAVGPPTSGPPSFHGVTGGVYKARERIHRGVADPRLLAIPASCGRVAAHNPNLDRLFAISAPLRVQSPASGATSFRGVTGGVYKARERIHRGMLIRDY